MDGCTGRWIDGWVCRLWLGGYGDIGMDGWMNRLLDRWAGR